jgi:hypothetical protein
MWRSRVPERKEKQLHEEVECEQKHAQQEKKGTPRKAAAGELGNGVNKTGRNDAETGLPAALIERTDGNVTREVAAEVGEFVVNPKRELRPMAPKGERAEDEHGVPEASKKTKCWTGTPIKHETSPRLGGKIQASS